MAVVECPKPKTPTKHETKDPTCTVLLTAKLQAGDGGGGGGGATEDCKH